MTIADHHTGDHGTATAVSGAATLHKVSGVITSESLSTAAGAFYTLTVTDRHFEVDSVVPASVANGTNTTLYPQIVTVTPAAGSCVFIVKNIHASSSLNGTIVVAYTVL